MRRVLVLAVLVLVVLALGALGGDLDFNPITEGGPYWDF